MPELYDTIHPYNRKINVAYYSEKGWLSFFLNFLLPQSPLEFLCFFEDPKKNKPFLLLNRVIDFVIFNELELGDKNGFGKIDGAIYLETKRDNYFIFIQALNEPYRDGSDIPEKSKLAFQKTINGRLELTYRFSQAVKYSLNKNEEDTIYEDFSYLHENYIKTDKFYIIPEKKFNKKKTRRMKIEKKNTENFLGRFFRKNTKFYFLTITGDTTNPLSSTHPIYSEHYTPRIYPAKLSEDRWEDTKSYFLWMPKNIIIDQFKPELSDSCNCPMAKFCYYYSGLKDFSAEKIAFETRDEVPSIGPSTYSRMDFWLL